MTEWVKCLNCGLQYMIESYAKDGQVKCPYCSSKESEYATIKSETKEDNVQVLRPYL